MTKGTFMLIVCAIATGILGAWLDSTFMGTHFLFGTACLMSGYVAGRLM